MDVLLVNPYVIRRHAPRMASYRPYPPLGLMYLAAVLREEGYDVEILDATFAGDEDLIRRRLLSSSKPRVAGIFAMSSFRDDALAAIEHLKEHGVMVIAGGPDPSIYDREYLTGGADLVVRGEGEVALLELLRAYGVAPRSGAPPRKPAESVLRGIAGLSFLDEDVHVHRAPDRAPSRTMDELPAPAYDLVDLPGYVEEWRRVHGYASLQFMTSRGCPFSCTWCARPIFGRKYRQYGPERAAEEIEHLVEGYGIEHLWLFDDTFVVRREWVEAFCRSLIQRGVKIAWECLARTDLVDRPLLELMREAGCSRINFGFESGSQRVLDGMKKGTNVADARRVAADMHALGISMGGYVLFGYPGEEWADIERTIELVRDLAPVDYSTSVAHPMPGTELHDLVRDMMTGGDWAHESTEEVHWETPYSPGFYKIVESLLHAEYELALEPSLQKLAKSKLLRAALFAMRVAGSTLGEDEERLERYAGERFRGWRGLRRPEQAARHRKGHAAKVAGRLRVVTS